MAWYCCWPCAATRPMSPPRWPPRKKGATETSGRVPRAARAGSPLLGDADRASGRLDYRLSRRAGRLVCRLGGKDLLLKALKERLAAFDPVQGVIAPGGAIPIALD